MHGKNIENDPDGILQFDEQDDLKSNSTQVKILWGISDGAKVKFLPCAFLIVYKEKNGIKNITFFAASPISFTGHRSRK